MKSEIIAVGTELLLGEILDTNSQFLAGQLASLGIDLYYTSVVGDNLGRLSGVLRTAWQRSELILTTGGLGPTQGDLTREAIAGLVGEEMRIDPALKQGLITWFARRGLEMPENNLKQAVIIPSARVLPNPRGTAPGWWVEKEGRTIVSLPGPPGEMQFMWTNQVSPRLQQKAQSIILSRTLKVLGLAESRLDELLSPWVAAANPTLATYAKPDGIHLRITAKAGSEEEARRIIAGREEEVRRILGDSVWGTNDETLENEVGRLLMAQGLTLAVAESFTRGFLTNVIAGVSRSESFLSGGLTVGSPEARSALALGEPGEGTDCSRLAVNIASDVREKLQADIGIAVEAVEMAGPNELVQVCVAIQQAGQEAHVATFSGRSFQMRRLGAYYALAELRKLLIEK